jgi:hypothetical protein
MQCTFIVEKNDSCNNRKVHKSNPFPLQSNGTSKVGKSTKATFFQCIHSKFLDSELAKTQEGKRVKSLNWIGNKSRKTQKNSTSIQN